MARFPRSRFQPPSRRRETTWVGGIQTAFADAAVAASASVLISSIDTRIGAAPEAPFTIIRVRGLLQVVTDQVIATEEPHGAYGICVVNGEAFDTGVAAVPTPFTESFDDRWLYHTYWASSMKFASSTGIPFLGSHTTIDSKAMRKVDIGDVIVTVIENGSSQHGARFISNKRTLVKLH